jgi:hypothetical protein
LVTTIGVEDDVRIGEGDGNEFEEGDVVGDGVDVLLPSQHSVNASPS